MRPQPVHCTIRPSKWDSSKKKSKCSRYKAGTHT